MIISLWDVAFDTVVQTLVSRRSTRVIVSPDPAPAPIRCSVRSIKLAISSINSVTLKRRKKPLR